MPEKITFDPAAAGGLLLSEEPWRWLPRGARESCKRVRWDDLVRARENICVVGGKVRAWGEIEIAGVGWMRRYSLGARFNQGCGNLESIYYTTTAHSRKFLVPRIFTKYRDHEKIDLPYWTSRCSLLYEF